MKRQTVMWTVLPNGVEDGKLRLSVFVSPRLQTDEGLPTPKLSQFPDFVEWPARIAGATFQVQFGTRPPVAAERRPAEHGGKGASLWKAVAHGDTYVKPHEFPKLSDRLIVSYPVRNVLTHLRQAYQGTALDSPTVVPRVNMGQLQARPVGRFLAEVAPPAQRRAAVAGQLDAQLSGGRIRAMFNPRLPDETTLRAAPAATAPPAGAILPPAAVSPVTTAFQQVRRFHEPARRGLRLERARPPVKPPSVDFHGVLSSLGQYPGVLRALGLVIDLEVPFDPSLAGSTTVMVVPTWSPAMATTDVAPKTRCTIAANAFAAQPRPDSDIAGGMLRLNDEDRFEVGQVDVDGAAVKALAVADDVHEPGETDEKEAPLPSLRTAGIWVARANRAHQLASLVLPRMETQQQAVTKLQANQAAEVDALYAEDLVRGYRVDVLEEESGQWRSLCRRVGQYGFENAAQGVKDTISLEDEGWVSSATTETTDDSEDDLYVHETLFTWDGWSLCVPRPMAPVKQAGVPEAGTDYGLKTTFTPTPGSLPKLRFGHSYRLRARVVDLAGNSLLPETTDAASATDSVEFARQEPVSAPLVLPRKSLDTSPGETVERLVIRTLNDAPEKDKLPANASSERHVAPPKTAQAMAERHGKFDGATGMKGDAATYQLIVDNDGILRAVEPAAQLLLPYFPDPLAAGATIRSTQIDVAPGPEDEVVKIAFDGDWPDVRPFRIRIAEISAVKEPTWFEAERLLVLPLPKAEIAEIWLSSYVDELDVPNLGLWRWTVEGVAAPAVRNARLAPADLRQVRRDLYAPSGASRAATRVQLAQPQQQQLQLLGTAVLKGMHWMVSPYRKLTLVHAVQQPLTTPDLKGLQASRGLAATFALLQHRLAVHGKSTLKVEIQAEWEEPLDIISEPAPRSLSGRQQVVELPVEYGQTEITMGAPAPEVDRPAVVPEGGPRRRLIAPRLLTLASLGTRHEFGDTKYRAVSYKAVATSRFREYFPFTEEDLTSGKVSITRTSAGVPVDVLSSARPLPPRVRYVIPTFGWGSTTTATGMESKRSGGGLRVYLERPWYSSGDGELLGVVLPTKQGPVGRVLTAVVGQGVPDALKRFVTQMGADPIYRAGAVPLVPEPSVFRRAKQTEDGLALDEVAGARVAVVGHTVQYDPSRQLWYCDIEMDPGTAYYPFVRLALARYQPKSVKTGDTDVKLSRVVLADFAQLAPDRAAAVSYNAAEKMADVSVSGVTYSAPGKGSEVEVSLETRQEGVAGPLGWVPVPDATVPLTFTRLTDKLSAWLGRIPVPADQPLDRYRLVVKEYERFIVDKAPEGAPPPLAMVAQIPTDRRLVYADVLWLSPKPEQE